MNFRFLKPVVDPGLATKFSGKKLPSEIKEWFNKEFRDVEFGGHGIVLTEMYIMPIVAVNHASIITGNMAKQLYYMYGGKYAALFGWKEKNLNGKPKIAARTIYPKDSNEDVKWLVGNDLRKVRVVPQQKQEMLKTSVLDPQECLKDLKFYVTTVVDFKILVRKLVESRYPNSKK